MKILKSLTMSAAIAAIVLQTGCMTTKQADTAKVESDAAIAAAQAETDAVRAEMEAAIAQAKADADTAVAAAEANATAVVAAAEADKNEIQGQLDEAKAKDAMHAQAAREIPGSVLTDNGTLLFTAEGQSVAKAVDGAEGQTKARMAAETIAKANLLELIKGGMISSSVSVGDMMFESQTVTSTVSGWLGGAVVDTEVTAEEKSNLPDAKPIDEIVTATATMEISISAWEDLQDYVE